MMSKLVLGLVTAGTLLLGCESISLADTNPIQARQACMKANGKMVGVMASVIKGEKPYDKGTIDTAIGTAEQACAGWANWWGEDTKAGGAVETYAKNEIWTDKSGFEAAGAAYVKAMGAVKASADEASFKAAFMNLGAACKGCHEKFRRPKE